MRRRIPQLEPIVWLTFSTGGVTAAMLLPVLVALFAFAVPLGWIDAPDHDHLHAVVSNPLTILALLGAFVVMLVHSAHRFRYTLYDGLQIKHRTLTALACYGSAFALSVAAMVILLAPL